MSANFSPEQEARIRTVLGLPPEATEDEVMAAICVARDRSLFVPPEGYAVVQVAELAALEGEIVDARCRVQTALRETYLRRNRAGWSLGYSSGLPSPSARWAAWL